MLVTKIMMIMTHVKCMTTVIADTMALKMTTTGGSRIATLSTGRTTHTGTLTNHHHTLN